MDLTDREKDIFIENLYGKKFNGLEIDRILAALREVDEEDEEDEEESVAQWMPEELTEDKPEDKPDLSLIEEDLLELKARVSRLERAERAFTVVFEDLYNTLEKRR